MSARTRHTRTDGSVRATRRREVSCALSPTPRSRGLLALRPRPEGGSHSGGEKGAGTVVALALIAVLLVLAVGATGLIQAQAAAGRARLAADLAALGGATALTSVLAPGEPCSVAQRVAEANGAVVTGCTVDGEDVTVHVAVGVNVLGAGRTATAAARAGPVE